MHLAAPACMLRLSFSTHSLCALQLFEGSMGWMDQLEDGVDVQKARPDEHDAALTAPPLVAPAPPPQLDGMHPSMGPCESVAERHAMIGVNGDGGTTPAAAAVTAVAPTPARLPPSSMETPSAAPWPPASPQHLLLPAVKRGSVAGMAGASLDAAFIESYVPRSLLPLDALARERALQDRRERLRAFREKKRSRRDCTRKIRYASRKAYAEVRPRIQGRFARKDEVAAMRAAGILPAA
jgi:CCT motif